MMGPPTLPPNCCHLLWGNGTGCNARLRIPLRERILGLGCIGAAEPESAAVNLVAARLGLNCDQPGDRFSELSVKIRSGDFGFGHRVQVRIDYDNAEDWILIVGAIQLESGSAKMLAIDEDLAAALRVLGRGM